MKRIVGKNIFDVIISVTRCWGKKVAQMFPEVAQKISTAVFYNNWFLSK